MRRLIAAVAVAVLAGLPALAHEGHVHKLIGTVTAVHADQGHVEMKDTKGAVQSFYVDKDTKIVKGKEAMTLASVMPGARVVVEAKTTGGRMVASTVRIGAADPGTPSAAPHHH